MVNWNNDLIDQADQNPSILGNSKQVRPCHLPLRSLKSVHIPNRSITTRNRAWCISFYMISYTDLSLWLSLIDDKSSLLCKSCGQWFYSHIFSTKLPNSNLFPKERNQFWDEFDLLCCFYLLVKSTYSWPQVQSPNERLYESLAYNY